MARDPLIDVLRRRSWAGGIDVLLLFVVFAAISIASGNGPVGTWTTNDGGFVTHHGVELTLPGGVFLAWVVIARGSVTALPARPWCRSPIPETTPMSTLQ